MTTQPNKRNKSYFGLFLGIALVVCGFIYLLYNFGIVDIKLVSVIVSFPMLLFALSTYLLIRNHFLTGLVGILVSSIFLIPRIDTYYKGIFPFDVDNLGNILFPLIFICIGLLIIYKVFRRKDNEEIEKQIFENISKTNFATKLKAGKNVVFGSSTNVVLSPMFEGSELNIIFGGALIDLRKTDIIEGKTILEANVLFGGCEIYLPSNWEVEINSTCIFGGVDDKRFYVQEKDKSNKKLVINGVCIFGGIEIKN